MDAQTSREMQSYYAARAPYYDAVYLKPERRDDIALLVQHIPDRLRGRSVLEVACGTGYWTPHIAPAAARWVDPQGSEEPPIRDRAAGAAGVQGERSQVQESAELLVAGV